MGRRGRRARVVQRKGKLPRASCLCGTWLQVGARAALRRRGARRAPGMRGWLDRKQVAGRDCCVLIKRVQHSMVCTC